jgi:hypothetical protein
MPSEKHERRRFTYGEEVYTVEKHVKSLVALLAKDEPCNCCPCARDLRMELCPTEMWDWEADFPCRICREFVGLEWSETAGRFFGKLAGCPCNALGRDEAIRRTFEALKAYQRAMILDV